MSQLGWRGGKIVNLCPEVLQLKVRTPITASFFHLCFLIFYVCEWWPLLFLSDMTENEKQKEGDDLMTCFVIHVSLLSLRIFWKQLFYKKACRLPPTYKFELCSSWFSINHRNIDNHFTHEMYCFVLYCNEMNMWRM